MSMSNLNIVFNWDSDDDNLFSFSQHEFQSPVNSFYTDKFINKILLYFNETFIAEGTCVKDDSYLNMYKIIFFKQNETVLHIDKLPYNTDILFIKTTNIHWGNIYYIYDSWDTIIYNNTDTVIKEYINLYNEKIKLSINNTEYSIEYTKL